MDRRIKGKRSVNGILVQLLGGAAGLWLVSGGMTKASAQTVSFQQTGFVMDTVVTEKIYTKGEDVTDELLELLEEVEHSSLSWTEESSEIYRINAANGETFNVSEHMATYLEAVLKLCADSEGAFDPTLGEVIRLWDIGGENQRIPRDEELAALLENVGWEKIALSGEELTLPVGTSLDLGAVGKGIGCDAAAEYLKSSPEITGALLNLGGSSVMTYGKKPDGSDWKIAIVNPQEPEGDYLGAVIMKENEFLSTSGNYKKYFEEDGVRYHHIFDPSTGYPAESGLAAVTVICDNGLNADALSTACFVLGREKGEKLLESYGADGLFVGEDGQVFLTEGMAWRYQ